MTGTSTISSNPIAPSNQASMATNELSSSNNVAATGNSNQLNSNFLIRDQAVTASDRQLLTTLSQSVDAQLGIASPTVSPVHFLIDNGAVTLVGIVPTADESQRITARVQQTPGVLSVFNDLHIGTAPTAVQPKTDLLGTVGNHAFSPADQSLLTTVEQESAVQLGVSGASTTQMPVHFSIQNGIVGVTGQVTSAQEKQALLAAIQRTPGVVRVVDNVMIGGGANTTVNPNGSLPATSGPNQSNRMFFLNPSNTTGF
jgi:osmotically-inducible protein OsmY